MNNPAHSTGYVNGPLASSLPLSLSLPVVLLLPFPHPKMVFTASSCSLTQLCLVQWESGICATHRLASLASLEPVSCGLNLPLFCLSVCPSCPYLHGRTNFTKSRS